MPRPRKCRRVCAMPETTAFAPVGRPCEGEPLMLTVDEYEMLRLIDLEGLSQEECGQQTGVARTTVQLSYASARRKVAQALVTGRMLVISGGEYQLCGSAGCGRRSCAGQTDAPQKEKGDGIMRIAATYENGEIFQHFGHTQSFKVYDVEDGKVVSSEVVSTGGRGHGALAAVLAGLQADVLICGGIGGGAQMALATIGVELRAGVSGSADEAVEAYLAGTLTYATGATCDHHHDHGEHDCGSHDCSDHHCGGGCH